MIDTPTRIPSTQVAGVAGSVPTAPLNDQVGVAPDPD
jgi:hypothetical protein